MSRECGTRPLIPADQAWTDEAGRFRFRIASMKNTTYVLRWRDYDSLPIRVRVRPRVTLTQVARARFEVRVEARAKLAGKPVWLQRFVDDTWKTVATARLRAGRATFRMRFPPGTYVRAMRPDEKLDCYVAGYSRALTVG